MVNLKGLASYCQECGACAALLSDHSVQDMDAHLVEHIVDEVVRTIQSEKGTEVSVPSELPLIPLGVSNRHVHITGEIFEKLFGTDSSLEVYRQLYQPEEFASKQVVTIAGPKMRAIQNARILGPLRKYTQVELSLTDAIYLGIRPPVRNSGDLEGAAPLTLIGPKSSVYLESCAIVANRHIHMTNNDARVFTVQDGDLCKVRIGGEKGTVFENILVRTNDAWKLQLHLDTDDANAAGTICGSKAEFLGQM